MWWWFGKRAARSRQAGWLQRKMCLPDFPTFSGMSGSYLCSSSLQCVQIQSRKHEHIKTMHAAASPQEAHEEPPFCRTRYVPLPDRRVASHVITGIISRTQTTETVCWVSLQSEGRRCAALATPAVTNFPFFHNVKFSLGCSLGLSGGKTTWWMSWRKQVAMLKCWQEFKPCGKFREV